MNQNTNQAEIDIRDMLATLVKRSWIIVVCMLLAAGGAWYYSKTRLVDYYSADATIYLGKEESTGSLDLGMISLNNQLISDYMSLINSRQVADEVVKRLNLDMPGEAFRYSINAYSRDTKTLTRMFVITYENTDPQLAADVVNTACEVVIEKAEHIFGISNAQIVDRALVPTYPIGPDRPRNVLIGAIGGAVAGIVIIFLIEFFDYTFKKPEDIQKKLGLVVLGTIPLFRGEKRK